MECKMLYVNVT